MKRFLLTFLVITCSAAFAADTPPSEASIREVLTLAGSQKLLDSMFGQIDGMMKMTMQKALGDRQLAPDQQIMMEKMQGKMGAAIREELSWDKMEPLYIKIYQQSFTQEELDGIIAFYKTPAGAALVKKMPLVMRNTMTAMQERMGPMMERMQKSIQESVAEIQAQKPK